MNPFHKDKLAYLDSIRGFAILLVFIFHALISGFSNVAYQPWGDWFRSFDLPRSFLLLYPATFGWVGVTIFFVVSGFCIHLSFARNEAQGFGAFFKKRFFRIYPSYLLAVVVLLVVVPANFATFPQAEFWRQFGSHALMIHNAWASTLHGINGSFWSLAVEVQLYLIYPLLILMVRAIGWRNAMIVTAVLEVTQRAFAGGYLTIYDSPPPLWFTSTPFYYWFSWSLGAMLADAWLKGNTTFLAKTPLTLWLVLGVVFHLIKPLSAFSFPMFASLTATVLAKLMAGDFNRLRMPGILTRHLCHAGVFSYSLYLWHQPLLEGLAAFLRRHGITNNLHIFVACVACWIIMVPIAFLLYRFVEQTGIRWGSACMKKVPLRAAAADALPPVAEVKGA